MVSSMQSVSGPPRTSRRIRGWSESWGEIAPGEGVAYFSSPGVVVVFCALVAASLDPIGVRVDRSIDPSDLPLFLVAAHPWLEKVRREVLITTIDIYPSIIIARKPTFMSDEFQHARELHLPVQRVPLS